MKRTKVFSKKQHSGYNINVTFLTSSSEDFTKVKELLKKFQGLSIELLEEVEFGNFKIKVSGGLVQDSLNKLYEELIAMECEELKEEEEK